MRENAAASGVVVDTQLFLRAEAIIDEALGRVARLTHQGEEIWRSPVPQPRATKAPARTGKGWLTTQSGVLNDQPYGFNTRFGDEQGTNPEELIAAAHAGCFTMALSFGWRTRALPTARLETTARVTIEQDGGASRSPARTSS